MHPHERDTDWLPPLGRGAGWEWNLNPGSHTAQRHTWGAGLQVPGPSWVPAGGTHPGGRGEGAGGARNVDGGGAGRDTGSRSRTDGCSSSVERGPSLGCPGRPAARGCPCQVAAGRASVCPALCPLSRGRPCGVRFLWGRGWRGCPPPVGVSESLRGPPKPLPEATPADSWGRLTHLGVTACSQHLAVLLPPAPTSQAGSQQTDRQTDSHVRVDRACFYGAWAPAA